jgi:surface antigen
MMCLVLLVSACGGGEQQRLSDAISAPLPAYGAGDSYTFDNGVTDRVVEAGSTDVRWRSSDGTTFVTTRNPMLPPVIVQASDSREEHHFVPPASFFPLRTGNTVMFLVSASTFQRSGQNTVRNQQWRCTVGKPARVSVEAGTFDTYEVTCSAFDMTSGRRDTHRYFYAPDIGFYVRREDASNGQPPQVAVLERYTAGSPPLTDSALRLRVEGIQKALSGKSGAPPTTWQDAATGASGQIRPLGTVEGKAGATCREFREGIDAYGRHYRLRGTACREGEGGWQVTSIQPDGPGAG